jgi:hypothetical protein
MLLAVCQNLCAKDKKQEVWENEGVKFFNMFQKKATFKT